MGLDTIESAVPQEELFQDEDLPGIADFLDGAGEGTDDFGYLVFLHGKIVASIIEVSQVSCYGFSFSNYGLVGQMTF